MVYNSQGQASFDLSEVETIQEFTHWVVIPNRFPYDLIFNVHDLLIPRRCFAFIRDATDEERHEYYAIKKQLDNGDQYHSMIENFSHARSAAMHFHAHLVHWKQ